MNRFWCLLLEGQAGHQRRCQEAWVQKASQEKGWGKKKEEVNSCATQGKVRVWGEGEA